MTAAHLSLKCTQISQSFSVSNSVPNNAIKIKLCTVHSLKKILSFSILSYLLASITE